MGAQVNVWMYFFVLFVLFASLNGKRTLKPKPVMRNPKGKTVFAEGNSNVINLCHNKEIVTALTQIQKKLQSLDEKISSLASPSPSYHTCKFDFESGMHGWQKTGTAFNNQPTYGDNSAARKNYPANQQGDWWIGGYENRPSKLVTAGQTQGDVPQGTLTSPYFKINGGQISFLIGGGCDKQRVRAELIIGNKAVRSATGKCRETMTRKTWNVHAFVGQKARVKLVDFSSGGWGHINFDDLKGDISCL